jgi:hypothetical protein
LQHLCTDGVLHEPDESNLGVDGSQFKGVFMRNLGELYRITGEETYRGAILTNANAVWSRNRNTACAFGSRWVGPFDASGAAQQSSALDALNGALQFDVAGSTYQAENGVLHNLSTESTHPGFHGTGYVAGWNADGRAVDVTVTVVRCIRVKGRDRRAGAELSADRQLEHVGHDGGPTISHSTPAPTSSESRSSRHRASRRPAQPGRSGTSITLTLSNNA